MTVVKGRGLNVIVIDVKRRTVEAATVERAGFVDFILKSVECDMFCLVRMKAKSDAVEDVYVDDEGLLSGPRHFFSLPWYRQPLAGNAVIARSDDEGDAISTTLTMDEVRDVIKFYLVPEGLLQ